MKIIIHKFNKNLCNSNSHKKIKIFHKILINSTKTKFPFY